MKDIDFESIGKKLKEIRLSKGLPQDAVASAAEVNTSHISNIENNRVKVSLPAGSSDLPKAWRAAFISLLFGLASNGVYMCHCCYQQCGSLLHCLSTLTIAFAMAVYFCCTGLGVASTGRYPASCPVKPGLSSPARMQPRSSVLLIIFSCFCFRLLSGKLLS